MREDAPAELREAVLQIARDFGWEPSGLRNIICRVLRVLPSEQNWTEYPNIWSEVQGHILFCPWYKVYDIIEELYRSEAKDEDGRPKELSEEFNAYFAEHGIGWQLADGRIEIRGPEGFEAAVVSASSALGGVGLTTAQGELHEALLDLSRRPKPDLSGALHHSMAALECALRDVVGDSKATLGDLLKRFEGVIPHPVDTAVGKLWGFASDQGRHVREGRTLEYPEVELVVSVAASVIAYVAKVRAATRS